MAYRYPVEWFESDDVVTPQDWLRNIREFTDEFNGMLDRDNLPDSSISEAMISANACTELLYAANSSGITPDADITTWQDLFSGTVDSDSDPEVFIMELSLTWEWPEYTHGSNSQAAMEDCRFRITLDGIPVAETDWLNRVHLKDSTYLCAASPVAPGRHTVAAQIQVAYPKFASGYVDNELLPISDPPTVNEGYITVIRRKR